MAIERGWFAHVVPIRRGPGVRLNVNNAMQAGELLLEEWPAEHWGSAAHVAARVACISAMEGGPVAPAEVAFREAAEEAGLLLPEI